jgi:hypothetical protein
VQDGAQAVHIGEGTNTAAVTSGLLGRHVRRCPLHGPGLAELVARLIDELRQSKVHENWLACRCLDHHIARLQVPVNHAALVSVGHGPSQESHQLRAAACRQ